MKLQETPLLPADTPQPLKVALTKSLGDIAREVNHQPVAIVIAVGDETTAITTGAAKVTFRMPFALNLSEIRGSLSTAQTSGAIFTVNVKNGGSTVFSTKLTIDNTEKTSTTAATLPVLYYGSTQILADAEITIDVDQIGDGTAKGLKVTLVGRMV